ncbi:hypothetical protein [Cupriavidus gilardii]|uniref:Uncharacterized protein n=1 Tax=Cupriavidus gilardii TaxID=82541 RepID=A0A849BFQ1_9BURK|nr:hypothetical protein [Cupriavidus gilardii]KAB0592798.1 hypothetical protein F7Q96_26040 [Cupriavidus gilardii]MCT9017160.1 hypothetical protein [Cupriavidus gilardii]MCT9056823.1 hypothetical protein [Cupriavidus gilardii]NNH14292.1 hypothetical protein [Cupriavidus gilardii]
MARIRTIKPEFPQSESMGNVSRDARLCFIQMWTLADDEGRLRGNSRMLASLLFPYDDDAKDLIDDWLVELEHEGCIVRYVVDGATYIEIRNWLIHQKIDKPSKSKLPSFDESSRILANPRERSSEDQGPKDQGKEEIPPNPPSPVGDEGAESSASQKPVRARKSRTSFATFLADCKAKGVKPVTSYRPLMDYVDKVRLPHEFLELAWDVFRREHSDGGANERRLQADWQRHFCNYVTKGYYRLWVCKPDGSFELTTVGQQSRKFLEAA